MKVTPRGRFWVGFWLVYVLSVLGWVVTRQTDAVITAGELSDRRTERAALESERATLVRRIRAAESRGNLVQRAEGLGLRMPADSEITLLPSPSGRVP